MLALYLKDSFEESAIWMRRAAEQGYARAQSLLANKYYFGRGVPKDYFQAYFWAELAAPNLPPDERDYIYSFLDRTAALLTTSQISAAKHLASLWIPKPETHAATGMPRSASKAAEPDLQSKKPETENAFGSALIISTKGEAITNAHVVKGCRRISVIVNGKSHPVSVLATDSKNDLALLQTELPAQEAPKWRLSVRQGEDVVAYGFPLAGVLSSEGNVVTGNATALAGLGGDSRYLQISAPVQPGNSGGPLFDRAGNVVGIVVAKLDALKIASATGDIPQNVNFAIRASVVVAFLDAQRSAHVDNGGGSPLSTPDITQRAKALTAQVACEN